MSKPTYLRFYLEHNEDEEITCLFCTLPRCDQSFTVSGGGKVSIIGVHNSCADKHMAKVTATKTGDS
jgi:hypothetical protein